MGDATTVERTAEDDVFDSGVRDPNAVRHVLARLLQISLTGGSLEDHLERVLEQVFSISWLALQSKGAIFLVGETPDVLVMKAQRGLPPALRETCAQVPFGRCMCGRAAATRNLVHAEHIDERHDVRIPGMAPHGHYCVPIILGGRTLGVINLYLEDGRTLKERDVEFLQAVAAVLAGIIQHRRVEEQLKQTLGRLGKALGGTIEVVASIVERRDPYTAGHQRRVASMAEMIAVKMGLAPDHVEAVRLAGLVHDVGKIAVPAEILSNPGKLSAMEMGIVRQHSQVGYDILKGVEFPWPIAQIVRQHHERMNGSGYPQGLSEEQILVEARILAVADVVEAMASHRPYRPALGMNRAMEEIARNRGVLFDTAPANCALAIYQGGGFELD